MNTFGKRWMSWLFPAVLLAMVAVSCQSGPPKIEIEDARAELSPAIIGESMVFMKIVNKGGADALESVTTDIPGATTVLHAMQGRRMVKVDIMRVPAERTIEFKPGDSHIMIENMPNDMREGSSFTLVLRFQKSGEKKIPLKLSKSSLIMQHGGHQM